MTGLTTIRNLAVRGERPTTLAVARSRLRFMTRIFAVCRLSSPRGKNTLYVVHSKCNFPPPGWLVHYVGSRIIKVVEKENGAANQAGPFPLF